MPTDFAPSTFLPSCPVVRLRQWWRRLFSPADAPAVEERIEPGINQSEAMMGEDSRRFNVYLGPMTVKRIREDGSEADFTETRGVVFSDMSYAKFHELQGLIIKFQADLHAAVAPK